MPTHIHPARIVAAGLALAGCLLLASAASAEIKTESVVYRDGEQVLEGFLAYDDAAKEPRPGVIVVHEWWGLTDHARNAAKKLAEAGYVGFAIDMYGQGKKTDEREQAATWSGEIRKNPALLQSRFRAGVAALVERPEVDPARIASIGFCFGGTVSLEAARLGEPLDAVASFHGGLASQVPADQRKPLPPILILHGGDDKFVSDEEMAGFKKEMEEAKAKYHIEVYPGAVHSFTNPDADRHNLPGAKYNAEAAEKSWAKLLEFFRTHLGKEAAKS